ncbi:Retrovirus-related Pol polyprotein from type-2 retrotransposable element R2DM [Symbiodinium microadriaticum]|uniref:Retrovirus-related Pol polyprotein from type-2 retrotransposable element R2DM n=1 Tax=Symbiodinium microadriaticum TaxID=2951 RepID=A0A1Q9DD90_SYMMI|nr:Retrovirus-related Pol polyprotein from type-2 retrotransposable element R2DM [Symbiodinium microadriaticum]
MAASRLQHSISTPGGGGFGRVVGSECAELVSATASRTVDFGRQPIWHDHAVTPTQRSQVFTFCSSMGVRRRIDFILHTRNIHVSHSGPSDQLDLGSDHRSVCAHCKLAEVPCKKKSKRRVRHKWLSKEYVPKYQAAIAEGLRFSTPQSFDDIESFVVQCANAAPKVQQLADRANAILEKQTKGDAVTNVNDADFQNEFAEYLAGIFAVDEVLYSSQTGSVSDSRKFHIGRGVKQGDIISPLLFNAGLEHAIREWKACLHDEGIHIGAPANLTNIRYADDLMLYAKTWQELVRMLERLKAVLANIGLELNAEKTRIITTASETNVAYIDVYGDMVQVLTDIETHMYLGRKIPADLRRCSVVEVAHRINAAWGKFNKCRVWATLVHGAAIGQHFNAASFGQQHVDGPVPTLRTIVDRVKGNRDVAQAEQVIEPVQVSMVFSARKVTARTDPAAVWQIAGPAEGEQKSVAEFSHLVPAQNSTPEQTLFVAGLNEGKFFGQDGAEEALKMVERIADHSPKYTLLFGIPERRYENLEQDHRTKDGRPVSMCCPVQAFELSDAARQSR